MINFGKQINRIKEQIKETTGVDKSVFVSEEHVMKDGKLHIKKVTKTGAEARMEIEKHQGNFRKELDRFFKGFFR